MPDGRAVRNRPDTDERAATDRAGHAHPNAERERHPSTVGVHERDSHSRRRLHRALGADRRTDARRGCAVRVRTSPPDRGIQVQSLMTTIELRPTGRLLLAFAMTFGLVSCTSGSSSPRPALIVLTPWTDPKENAAFPSVIDAFKLENPGIAVTVEPPRALNQVLQSDVQKGEPPDLAVLPNPGPLSSYATAGD